MIKYKDILERPNVNVPWNKSVVDEILAHFGNHYISTGKMLGYKITLTNLTSTSIIIFETQNDHDEFFSDPVLADWVEMRNTFNTNSNFVHTLTETTEINDTDIDFLNSVGHFGIFMAENEDINVIDEFKSV